jgi:hypothetical protein
MPAPYVRGEPLVTVSFRVSIRDEARIRAQAAREGRNPTQLIRGATLAYLASCELASGVTRTEQEPTE